MNWTIPFMASSIPEMYNGPRSVRSPLASSMAKRRVSVHLSTDCKKSSSFVVSALFIVDMRERERERGGVEEMLRQR